ncbi:hypothetical protein GCM10009767_26540 [Kocuria aegyptia]|uniref:Secreted protein n=1 Tax=Kocuria aegyptia TaxID=330943 RepID=A0ABN2KUN0_9MICC
MLVAVSLPAGPAATARARSFLCRLIIFSARLRPSAPPGPPRVRAAPRTRTAPPVCGRGAVRVREYSGGDPRPPRPPQETGPPCT